MNDANARFLLLKMALVQWMSEQMDKRIDYLKVYIEQMIKAADNNGFALIDDPSLI
jgi:hypothetical protein|nr:hypothetical protein [Enterococcus sp.]